MLTETLNLAPALELSPADLKGQLCDTCGMEATFIATLGDSKLTFCGHHIRKNITGLLTHGFTVYPENYSVLDR